MSRINLSYYRPINKVQEEFHQSPARHRYLCGGYGGGKTYPMIHEVFRFCFEEKNKGHNFAVFRNSWDSLKENIEEEMVDVAHNIGAVEKWEATQHNLYLFNGLKIMFRPLSIKRSILKGFHLCGFFVDDGDDEMFQDVLSFLFSRLRNPAKPNVWTDTFKTFWTGNWEGHTWLWRTFNMGDKKPGECNMALVDPNDPRSGEVDPFAYWMCKTTENSTLPATYVSDMAKIHSQSWMERYIYMTNLEQHSGLIYSEFNPATHNSPPPATKDLIRIMAVDVGFHTTAVVDMSTDGKAIYVHDEWYQKNITTSVLGEYLQRKFYTGRYKCIVIDPASSQSDQTSGVSVRDELVRNFGLRIEYGQNDVKSGIYLMKDLLRPATGDPALYVEIVTCPEWTKEVQSYRWKEFDEETGWKEVPEKKNDHALDATRYGACYLNRFLKNRAGRQDLLNQRRKDLWDKRITELRMYQRNPQLVAEFNRGRVRSARSSRVLERRLGPRRDVDTRRDMQYSGKNVRLY